MTLVFHSFFMMLGKRTIGAQDGEDNDDDDNDNGDCPN